MKKYIQQSEAQLQAILDGSEIVWNGDNLVGKQNDAARRTLIEIGEELEAQAVAPYYQYWTVEAWMTDAEIKGEWNDEKVKEFADTCEPESQVILDGDIEPYVKRIRNRLRRLEEV